MKHIILICHKAHLVSGSVNFIKSLFSKSFNVDLVTGDLSLSHVKALLKNNSDSLFVLWQTEYLAPWLISMGRKVIVFPMYDGCGKAPKSYFKILDKTYLFNFSKKLHEKCVNASVVSYQLTFYPQKKEIKTNKFKKDRMFYWLRRPNSLLALSNIIPYFSSHIDNIHVHDLPDEYSLKENISQVANAYISTSSWFKNKNDLLIEITNSKYYLAPRESEGIGMAFLEAMQQGCIVFANNESTHDQYIFNGHNGFLIDFSSNNEELIKLQIQNAFEIIKSGKPIGENAKRFIEEGLPIWNKQSEKILGVATTIVEAPNLSRSNWAERKIGFILARVYYIHPWVYFIFTDIAIKLGYFTHKRSKYSFKGALKLVFITSIKGYLKLLRMIKR